MKEQETDQTVFGLTNRQNKILGSSIEQKGNPESSSMGYVIKKKQLKNVGYKHFTSILTSN